MKMIKPVMLSLSITALAAGGAFAQTAMTKSDTMSKPMSASDMKMMKSCQAMSHDMMMKNKGCMKMMKAHPEMSSGSMSSGSMSTGAMTTKK